MVLNKDIKIVAFVGLAGSGKSVAVDYVTEKGYPKVYFGTAVLGTMAEMGIEHTEANEKAFREDLRVREGKDFIAKLIIRQIHDLINSGQHRIIAESLYSWTEYKALKREFPGEFSVIAVVAPKRLRHRRLLNRPIRPYTQAEADQRDWAEIENLEKGGPITIADHFVINNGTLEHLHEQIDEALNDIEFYND
jgi:dephospho-CoA kinase